jgi:hypothetical protein
MKKIFIIIIVSFMFAMSVSAYTTAELKTQRDALNLEYIKVKAECDAKLKLITDRLSVVDKSLATNGETKITVPTTEEYDAAVAK